MAEATIAGSWTEYTHWLGAWHRPADGRSAVSVWGGGPWHWQFELGSRPRNGEAPHATRELAMAAADAWLRKRGWRLA